MKKKVNWKKILEVVKVTAMAILTIVLWLIIIYIVAAETVYGDF